MKLIVLSGTDDGMLQSSPNTPAVALTVIDGVIWEGRGATVELARCHLAKRLNELHFEINEKKPDFDHVVRKRPKTRFDT